MFPIPTFEGSITAALVAFVLAGLWQKLRNEHSIQSQSSGLIDELRKTIEGLHDRNKELNDRYHDAVSRNTELATKQSDVLMQAVGNVQREHQAAMLTIYSKLDAAEKDAREAREAVGEARQEVQQCRDDHHDCQIRLSALERIVTGTTEQPAEIRRAKPP